MNNFKITSNRGNATYYIMVVIMVITIMTSGLLFISLRSSVISHNYATDIEDYNKCESALMKIKGELKVELENKQAAEYNFSVLNNLVLEYSKPTADNTFENIHYFILNDVTEDKKLALYHILGEDVSLVKAEEAEGFEVRFKVDQNAENNGVEKYFVIFGVNVESGKVGIKTDIKIMLGSDNKITDVVFDNYKVYSIEPEITPEPTPSEGGDDS